jgi:hypothetical protein
MIESKLDMSKYRSNFKIVNTLEGKVIFYKSKPLWRAGQCSIEDLEFLVIGGDFDDDFREPYTLSCKDNLGDYYCYGTWNNLEDVIKFLEN